MQRRWLGTQPAAPGTDSPGCRTSLLATSYRLPASGHAYRTRWSSRRGEVGCLVVGKTLARYAVCCASDRAPAVPYVSSRHFLLRSLSSSSFSTYLQDSMVVSKRSSRFEWGRWLGTRAAALGTDSPACRTSLLATSSRLPAAGHTYRTRWSSRRGAVGCLVVRWTLARHAVCCASDRAPAVPYFSS